MGTALGVLLGALATVLASRYYYLRSIKKSLGVYGLLDSLVFEGIELDVRKQLHFYFREKEVNELQQLVLLIANDGERAISNVIEPLTLTIPPGVELLDASILHRQPDALRVQIGYSSSVAPNGMDVSFEFPLLNRGEFFVVKLLLSGKLLSKDLAFGLLADDLPRVLPVKDLPTVALEESGGYKIDWGSVVAGAIVLVFPAWALFCLYLLHRSRPNLFPYPWASYVLSAQSLGILIPGIVLLGTLSFLGLTLLMTAVFGGAMPRRRGPRFPLPKELRHAVFPHHIYLSPPPLVLPEPPSPAPTRREPPE